MQAQKQVQKTKPKNQALDDELDQEYKELEKSLQNLNTNIVQGNLELKKQDEELSKVDKELIKVQNNNSKSLWIMDASKNTWTMLKGLFTKPKLVKEAPEANKTAEQPLSGPAIDDSNATGDRTANLAKLAQDAKANATLQNKAINDTTKKIDNLNKREQIIQDQQKKMKTKMDKL